jgi:hypothetical protein
LRTSEQYRDSTGKPLYPQRPLQTSELFNQSGMMKPRAAA